MFVSITAPGIVEFNVNNLSTDSEAEVSWTPPLQPNGVIISYQVIYSVYGDFIGYFIDIITSENDTTRSYIIRNLGMYICI